MLLILHNNLGPLAVIDALEVNHSTITLVGQIVNGIIPARDQLQAEVDAAEVFRVSKKRRRPAYISDRDPDKPRTTHWVHPPVIEPPPRPTAELRASPAELLARANARSRPDDEAVILLLLAA